MTARQIADHYETLGVHPDATQAEVNAAFRRLAREQHPDRFAGAPDGVRAAAEEAFKRLSVAFEVLRDAERREAYDLMRAGRAPAQAIEVEPPLATVRSAAGTFSVAATLVVLEGALADMQLDVRCDDGGIELMALDARPEPGAPNLLRLTVRGRVVDGGSRTMHLLYTAGAAAAAQSVDLRVAAPGLRGFMRNVSFTRFGGFWGWFPYAVVVLGIALAIAGGSAYAVGAKPGGFIALSFGIPMTIVGLVVLARNWVIMRFALEGWGRWIIIVLTVIGIRVALIFARDAF